MLPGEEIRSSSLFEVLSSLNEFVGSAEIYYFMYLGIIVFRCSWSCISKFF